MIDISAILPYDMPSFKEIVELMQSKKWKPPIAELIGMELVECEKGTARFRMRASEKHHNPMGTLHGGVMVDIMDASMGMAFASTLNEGEKFTTVNLQANYLKQVIEDELVATAEVIKRGRSIGFVEAKLHNSDDELVATAQSTCKIFSDDNVEA